MMGAEVGFFPEPVSQERRSFVGPARSRGTADMQSSTVGPAVTEAERHS
jgi:hypothetical protein